MEVIFSANAQKDIKYWKKRNDVVVMNRISELLSDVVQTPYQGIGNPEALKHELSGCWSRRINGEHRLVYQVVDNTIEVLSLRFHY